MTEKLRPDMFTVATRFDESLFNMNLLHYFWNGLYANGVI